MADNKGDIKFTFDSSEFKTAVKEIVSSMGKVQENTKHMSEKVGKGMGGALDKFALKAVAIIAIVKGIFTALQQNIPEIGTTLAISGQIITRNLLNPLRKELLPILQKVLNWVRDNRVAFVQFGVVLVNVFKTIKGLFMALYSAVEPVVKLIKDVVKSIFGDTAKSVSETINMVLLKIVAFAILAGDMVRPIFEGIAHYIKGVITVIKMFVAGFIEGFTKTFGSEMLKGLIQDFKDMFTSFGDALIALGPAFKVLGTIIGGVFALALTTVIGLVRTLLNMLELLFKIISNPAKIKEAWASFKDKEISIGKEIGATAVRGYDTVKESITGKGEKVDDVIVTKEGRVLKTSPEDTIMAMKKNTSPGKGGFGGGKMEVNFNFGHFKVYSTEGDASKTGMLLAKGMEKQIKNILLETMNTEGAY